MSETIQEAPDRPTMLRNRHLDFYVDFVEQVQRGIRGPDQRLWWGRLDAEYDNIRLALEWGLESHAPAAALKLATALSHLWDMRGDPRPALEWVDRALALAGDDHPALRAEALMRRGWTCVYGGDIDKAFAAAQEAVAAARESGDDVVLSQALRRLGQRDAVIRLGGKDVARALLDEAVERARASGDELALADALSCQWTVWSDQGRDAALAKSRQVLEIYRRLGDTSSVAWQLYEQAWALRDRDVEQRLAQEALALGRELENDVIISCVIQQIGWLHMMAGHYPEALEVYRAGLAEFRMPGRRWPVPWVESWMLAEQADLEILMGEFASARLHADEAVAINRKHSFDDDLVWPLAMVGYLTALDGNAQDGYATCREAVAIARRSSRPFGLRRALMYLGRTAIVAGDTDAARTALLEAAEIGDAIGQGWSATIALGIIAEIFLAEGNYEEARAALESGLERVRASGRTWAPNEAVTQLHLGRVARMAGELETAAALLTASLTRLLELQHLPLVTWGLEETALLAIATGHLEKAATLVGAAAGNRERARAKRLRYAEAEFHRATGQLRERLDESVFDAALTAGQTMAVAAAVALATETG